ncbi:MAG: yabG, partial [Bacillales bacterium]|nr:yabG [Bacillales bacterium]
ILSGEELRLIADAPIDDLELADERTINESHSIYKEKEDKSFRLFQQDYYLTRQKQEIYASGGYESKVDYFQIPGRILHLDGDPIYLKKCMDLYKKIGVPVQGYYCKESEFPEKIGSLLDHVKPDILVLTGHDAYTSSKGTVVDLKSYRNTKYFIEAVQIARNKVPQLDQLVIFAGACQSHFEAIIKAGANFASSPSRVNIHALDPVYVVSKISLTSFMDRINVWDVVRNTITGEKGIGGIESRGLLRIGLPYQSLE